MGLELSVGGVGKGLGDYKNIKDSPALKTVVSQFEKVVGIDVTKIGTGHGRATEVILELPNGKGSFDTAQRQVDVLKDRGVIPKNSKLIYLEGQGGKAMLLIPRLDGDTLEGYGKSIFGSK